MSTTLPAIGIDVEVSLGIAARYPGGVWDSGSWDYNTWQQTDTALGDWQDVTCQTADRITFGAGSSADGVVTRWEAATCSLQLVGAVFDPRSGPYAGLLGTGMPVRVRWKPSTSQTWLVAFIGSVDDDGFSYDPKKRTADLAATDGTRKLAAFDGTEQPAVGLNDTAAQRVARIADMASWPTSQRDITAGGVTLQATTLADAAWSMLLAVADTDLALLWISRAGLLSFRPEGKVVPQHTMAATITCDPADAAPGDTVIAPVTIEGQQPVSLRNVVSISRQAPDGGTALTVTMRDDASAARFLPHTYQRTDLLHTDDTWSTKVAQSILMTSAWPSTAPATVDLSSRADAGATALLLGLEPSLSVRVSDGVGIWVCEPAGWTVELSRTEVHGTIQLLDVTTWLGSSWDADGWDMAIWGW